MKRLFAIFLSSVVVLGLFAQNVPMAIYGDVYIDNAGVLLSKGSVHIQATAATTAPDKKVGRVDNHGKMIINDTIIFYTNSENDGLLKNENYVGVNTNKIVDANYVAVRKHFASDNAWYRISLPFDVNLGSGIKNPLSTSSNPNPPNRGEHYDVQYYNATARAQEGGSRMNSGGSYWDTFTGSTLQKGIGYRVKVNHNKLKGSSGYTGDMYLEFVATANKVNRDSMFLNIDKGLSLNYDAIGADWFIPGAGAPANEYWSDGWNVIGGLNTDEFIFNKSLFTSLSSPYYSRPIYFWMPGTGVTDYREFHPDGSLVATLRPYATVFVKTAGPKKADGTTNPNPTPLNFTYNSLSRVYGGGFAFYHEGNSLDVTGPYTFRSEQTRISNHDLFELIISDVSGRLEPLEPKAAYFKFNNDYDKSFMGYEDDVMMATAKCGYINVWSNADIENQTYKGRLFVNALPYEEQEVPLGINIPAAGEYIFSLKHILEHENRTKEIESVVLWDKEYDIKIELLNSPYLLHANSDFISEDRFVLFFNSKDVTGLDKMPDLSEPYAYTENNMLTVKNLMSGDRVQVYDLTGRSVVFGVAPGNTFTAPLNQKGIYIVNVKGGRTFKVLNK